MDDYTSSMYLGDDRSMRDVRNVKRHRESEGRRTTHGSRARLSKRYAEIEKALREDVGKLNRLKEPVKTDPAAVLRCYRMAFNAFLEVCEATSATFTPLMTSIKEGYELLIHEGFESKLDPLLRLVSEQQTNIASLKEDLEVARARCVHNQLEIDLLKRTQIPINFSVPNVVKDSLTSLDLDNAEDGSPRNSDQDCFEVDLTCPDAYSGIMVVEGEEHSPTNRSTRQHPDNNSDTEASDDPSPVSWLQATVDTSAQLEPQQSFSNS